MKYTIMRSQIIDELGHRYTIKIETHENISDAIESLNEYIENDSNIEYEYYLTECAN